MRLPRGTGERGGTLAVAMVLAFAVPRAAAAQVGTTTDIITGTVTGRDSQPLAGALVQATSLETQVSRPVTVPVMMSVVVPTWGAAARGRANANSIATASVPPLSPLPPGSRIRR